MTDPLHYLIVDPLHYLMVDPLHHLFFWQQLQRVALLNESEWQVLVSPSLAHSFAQ